MRRIVVKYGGSSLATTENVRHVAALVHDQVRQGETPAVVVSARGDTTDELVAVADRLSAGADHTAALGRERDQLLACGEVASAAQLALALRARGVDAISLTAAQAAISVRGAHGAGVIDEIDVSRVREALDAGRVPVVAGFHGIDAHDDVTTLGRGGSDTTAVALAVALDRARCVLNTDVDGVFSADPSLVPDAHLFPTVGDDVLCEMAFGGARVVHPRAAELARLFGVELWVRNTFGDQPGTRVVSGGSSMIETAPVAHAVVHDGDVAHLTVHAFGPDPEPGQAHPRELVAEALAEAGVPAEFVGDARLGSGLSIGLAVASAVAALLAETITEVFGRAGREVRVDTAGSLATVSLVGSGLLSRPRCLADVLAALRAARIVPLACTMTQSRCTVLVRDQNTATAVGALHEAFGLGASERADSALVSAS
ncbi:aspartate kinase [Saccharomonospora saliphila]|uniref:aspartate kinase n=1 Tax=Saccharomonospora saliphila TaxID=369829 RepID=UPI0003810A10|nr:aspartate kinase [Saccharomonospora saliphila]